MPKLFLVDPQCAIVNLFHELSDLLASLFGTKGRTAKHYIIQDVAQLPREKLQLISQEEVIMPNSFGDIVRNFVKFDFAARA